MAVSVVVKVVKGRDSDFRATAVLEMVAAKAKAKAAAALALTVHWYDLRDRQKEKERERESLIGQHTENIHVTREQGQWPR